MSMRIRACPTVRAPQRERPRRPVPEFRVRDAARHAPPARQWGATSILKSTLVLIALAAGALTLWSAARGPDPHYLAARKLVDDYEFGKVKQATNYEHPVYDEALRELALVDPDSPSAEAADALRVEILRNVADFRDRQARIAERRHASRMKTARRAAIEFETRVYSKLIPFDHEHHPECE